MDPMDTIIVTLGTLAIIIIPYIVTRPFVDELVKRWKDFFRARQGRITRRSKR